MTTSPHDKPKTHRPGVFENPAREAIEEELHLRMIASAAGMAQICTIKTCRRRKRCFGPFDGDLPCVRRHDGLMRERFHSALKLLGWSHALDDLEDDID